MRTLFLFGVETMRIQEVTPMSPAAFREHLTDRGWSDAMLAKRWGKSARRVQQIVKDADRPRYLDDAVNSLPFVLGGAGEITQLEPMSAEAFKSQLDDRGWSEAMLAKRWGLSTRRVHQIVKDQVRPCYYDDAVMALPTVLGEPVDLDDGQPLPPEDFNALITKKGWTHEMLSRRWGVTVRMMQKIELDSSRSRYFDDAAKGLPVLPGSSKSRLKAVR